MNGRRAALTVAGVAFAVAVVDGAPAGPVGDMLRAALALAVAHAVCAAWITVRLLRPRNRPERTIL